VYTCTNESGFAGKGRIENEPNRGHQAATPHWPSRPDPLTSRSCPAPHRRNNNARLHLRARDHHRRRLACLAGIVHLLPERQEGDRDQSFPARHDGGWSGGLSVLGTELGPTVQTVRTFAWEEDHREGGIEAACQHGLRISRLGSFDGDDGCWVGRCRTGTLLRRL